MPVPFDDPPPEAARANAVAWLRFVGEEDGGGVRAALFQTTSQGEPLELCFARATRRGSAEPPGTGDPGARAGLAKSLFRAVEASPMLVLGLADEVPPRLFTDTIRLQVPLCLFRIGAPGAYRRSGPDSDHGGPVNGRLALTWSSKRLRDSGRHTLDALMGRNEPQEPFERAADALAEAFRDERVRSMCAISGLSTVVRLSAPPRDHGRPAHRTPAAAGALRSCGSDPALDANLAERLWAILAAPPHQARDFRLRWPGDLMPFQKDGVNALLSNSRLLLADDMGLGKTLQAIAALRILRVRREVRACLVAAPAGLLEQWRRELAKWAPELSAIIIRGSASDRGWQWAAEKDVTLVSYDTLRSDLGRNVRSPVHRKIWDVVVADEAQRIKNRNETSAALKRLPRRRSWALTGTPIENDEEELASILEFVDFDERTGAASRYRPGMELRDRHRELQLRRKKSEVLDDLPSKQVARLTIELGPRQRESYDKAEREGIVYLKSLGAEVGVRHVLELITRLKQICNADPRTGESSKLADVRLRLGELAARNHKALLFSQYTSDTSGVAAAADRLREFHPLVITGEIPPEERAGIIDRFRKGEEHKVLILSLRAGGLGLNLQEASYVFHLDRWWNPAMERQAEDRTHRIGQTVKVNVLKYSCAGTIEERIDEILEGKQNLFDALIDDVSLDLSAQLDRDELFGLFGLERRPDRDR